MSLSGKDLPSLAERLNQYRVGSNGLESQVKPFVKSWLIKSSADLAVVKVVEDNQTGSRT